MSFDSVSTIKVISRLSAKYIHLPFCAFVFTNNNNSIGKISNRLICLDLKGNLKLEISFRLSIKQVPKQLKNGRTRGNDLLRLALLHQFGNGNGKRAHCCIISAEPMIPFSYLGNTCAIF